MNKLKKVLKNLLKVGIAFGLVGIIFAAVAYYIVFNVGISKDPEGKFDRDAIVETLSGETRVYFNDEERKLGAFFDVNHRIYVPYGEIPEHIVNALIAAEDARFFEHNGFDFKGFFRAMFINIRAMAFVQGGSTLTQQTVKNIFGREERSVLSKFKELRDAIKLERHFTKEQILEFYLNQFHVAGSGKGVAIAAQYFFDKELKDLTLEECAFIAGSVKGPFNYDPFAQRNQERKERALNRGRHRVQYVLLRMLEDGYISEEAFEKASKTPLKFKHGTFRFSVSTPLALIEEKLNSEYFQNLFEKEGIEDWRKAQLEIISTLDADYQNAMKKALQGNISDLQLKLGGFKLPNAERPNRALKANVGDYLYGALDSIQRDDSGKLKAIYLSFGQIHGVIEQSTLNAFEKEIKSEKEKVLATKLGKGSVLLVSILDSVAIDGFYRCKIETEPVLQGAIVAIQNGKVKASQGGFHNTGFDRSFKAKRQLGSSFKPLLFALAFKYHWNYLDEIENSFNVFQYGNQFYFPRPDHKNKGDVTSIAYAGVRSENIASVWLLDHLFDKLSTEEFEDVASENGYTKKEDETSKAYFERLRDKYGLILKENTKREIEFDKAKTKLVEEFYNQGQNKKARALQNMLFGSFIANGKKQAITKENKKMLDHNYLRYEEILREYRLNALDTLTNTQQDPALTELYPDFSLADFMKLSLLVESVEQETDYLTIENLKHWPDFRRSLAMADFAKFLKEIGIQNSKIQQVQSMVLGVNEVTLAEITTAYETILTGKVFCAKDGACGEPALIERIRNRDGKIIFQNEITEKKILNDTITSQMAIILNAVFSNGTAYSKYDYLSLVSEEGNSIHFPAMGKTGTTNDFKNVAFLGALPTFNKEKNGFTTDTVLAIGSYVGFDDNKPLKSGRTRIAGSSGGLPQWATFAKEVLKIRQDASHIDFYSIELLKEGKIPLLFNNLRGTLTVDAVSGIAVSESTVKTKTLPWLDVPGFIAPQIQSAAAEEASENGFVTISPNFNTSTSADSLKLKTQTPETDDTDWELPEDFKGENAFVPIEVDF